MHFLIFRNASKSSVELLKRPTQRKYFKMVGRIERLKGLNVANHLEKRSLLIAINSIAALSIFFFGYDQGMMGGVNVSIDQPIYRVAKRFEPGTTKPSG